jgi:uroporphyrin-III C-methyltransferase
MEAPVAEPSVLTPAMAATNAAAPAVPVATGPVQPKPVSALFRLALIGAWVLLLVACVALWNLWQRTASMQEQLARQSTDALASASAAQTLAKGAQDLSREVAARQALLDAKLAEVALQRTQFEELMQSLSRSRDENLLVDIESALRLAQQQSVLTGSVEPMLAALKSADQRIARAAQPRLSRVARAVAQDIDRVKASSYADVPAALMKLDELVRTLDEAPLANAVAPRATTKAPKAAPANAAQSAPSHNGQTSTQSQVSAWGQWLTSVRDEMRGLIRVSRIDAPEAALVAPEQSWMLRENLKLRVLNARLGLLARQFEAANADLDIAQATVAKYFDTGAKKTQVAQALAAGVQQQLRAGDLPRLDGTLAALSAAAAGK